MNVEPTSDFWNGVAANLKARRVAEEERRKAFNAGIDWSWLPDRCPHCRMSWTMFPPAKIENANRTHTGSVRCVECKLELAP